MEGGAAKDGAAAAMSAGDHRGRFVLNLPPGFHFAPTEDELVVHYLRPKLAGLKPLLPIFQDERMMNSYRPEEIVAKNREYGEGTWYFFVKRERRYPTGNRPVRTTPGNGFWKATGCQRMIHSGGELVGRRKTLVFYTKPEKGEEVAEEEVAPSPALPAEEMGEETALLSKLDKLEKTDWTVYEYENLASEAEAADKNVDKIDEWVLCTIQKRQRCDDEKKGKRKEEGKEGSPGSGNSEEGSRVGGKKRKSSEVPIPQPHTEIPVAPAISEGDYYTVAPNMGVMVEYTILPMEERSPVPMQQPQESQHPEMMPHFYNIGQNMVPTPWQLDLDQLSNSEMISLPVAVGDNNFSIGPDMVSTPWQAPPHTDAEMTMFPPVAGNNFNNNNGSNMISLMPWHGTPQPEIMMVSPHVVPPQEEAPRFESEMASLLLPGDNYNIGQSMARQMITNDLHPDAAAAPLHQAYGGVAQNRSTGHSDGGYALDGLVGTGNNGYSVSYPLRSLAAGTNTLAMFMKNGETNHSHGGLFAGYQYHGTPAVHDPGRVVGPAAVQPRQDQLGT